MNVNDLNPNGSLDYRQLRVAIGAVEGKYEISLPHFEINFVVNQTENMVFVLPDTVAEHFRQQGRRELQAELRKLLNAERG